MKPIKKRGRKTSKSYLLNGDRAIDESRLRSILVVNNLRPTDVAKQLNISETSVSMYLRRVANSARFFRFMEELAKENNVTVQRAY